MKKANVLFILALSLAVTLGGCATMSQHGSDVMMRPHCDACEVRPDIGEITRPAKEYVVERGVVSFNPAKFPEDYVDYHSVIMLGNDGVYRLVLDGIMPEESRQILITHQWRVTTTLPKDNSDVKERTLVELKSSNADENLKVLLSLGVITSFELMTRDKKFFTDCREGFNQTYLDEPDGGLMEELGHGYVGIGEALGFGEAAIREVKPYYKWRDEYGKEKVAILGPLSAVDMINIDCDHPDTEVQVVTSMGERGDIWCKGDTYTIIQKKD